MFNAQHKKDRCFNVNTFLWIKIVKKSQTWRRKRRTESSSDQEQEEDDKEDTDWARLEDDAPSAEDYSSQSDDDTEGNDSSSNIGYRYTLNLSSSSNQ